MSIVFYISILLFSTTLLWLSELNKNVLQERLFLFLSFIVLFFPSALRYNIGTDYLEYVFIYNNYNYLYDYKDEFLFYCINLFLKKMNADVMWMFAIHAFIFTLFSFKAYPKEKYWIFHFILMCFLYFYSFNIIRQAVSIVICLFALKLFINKNTLLSVFYCLIAALFHKSAYFFLFFVLISMIKVSDYFKIYIAPILFILCLFVSYSSFFIFQYIEKILLFIGFTDFANYFHSSTHFIERQLGSGIGIGIYLLMSLYISFNTKIIIKDNPRYWAVIILMMLYAIILVLSSKIIIFGRMVITFLPGYVWAVYLAYTILGRRKLSFIFVSLFLIFIGLSFIKDSFGIPNYYYDPKRVPYQTVLKDVF